MSRNTLIQIDLSSPVTLAGAKAGLRKFLFWWEQELIASLPTSWQHRYQASVRTPILILGKDAWHLTNFNDAGRAFSFDPDQPVSELRGPLIRVIENPFANSVEAQFSKDDVLFRRISLPAAAASRLRSIVRLQLDRLSPFRGDDVCFDYQLITTADDGEITVEIAIVSKSHLYRCEQKLREMGFVPRLFTIADSTLAFSPKGIPWTKRRQTQALLAFCGVIVWLAVLWLAPIARDYEITSLEDQISSLGSQARAAESERHELERYQLPPMATSADRQRALEILLTLTKSLPQSVHLTSFTLQGGTVTLRGAGPPSVNVKTLLTRTRLFGHINFSQKPSVPGENRFESITSLRPTYSSGGSGDAP
jgi:general secretion pathway protein L